MMNMASSSYSSFITHHSSLITSPRLPRRAPSVYAHGMNNLARGAVNFILVLLGIFSAAFGLKGFLLSSRFIDGGVTGISMLLSDVTGQPLALFIPLINLPFIALGYKQVGARFALKSAVAIA